MRRILDGPLGVPEPGTLRGGEVAALALIALAGRLPMLPLRLLVEGDGAIYAALARDLLVGDFSGIANSYWSNLWPGVIAAAAFATRLDVVEAGRACSLISGVLVVVLAAQLGSRVVGRASGLLVGAIVAGHPWLIQFSTLVFTESFFCGLLAGALLALLVAQRSEGPRASLVAGLVLGLGVVTRPETFSVVAAAVVFLLLTAARAGEARRGLVKAGTVLLAVGLFLVVRALVVHSYYQEWDFGIQAKGTANLLVGLAEGDVERERVAAAITPAGENQLDADLGKWTLLSYALAHKAPLLRHVRRNLDEIAASVRRVFPPAPVLLGRDAFGKPLALALLSAAAPVSLLLALVGLAAGLARRGSRTGVILLGAVLVLYLLGLAPLLVHDRLVVALVPLFAVFLGHGLHVAFSAALGARWGQRAGLLVVGGAGLLSLWSLLRAPLLEYSGDPPIQREAGLWLRERFPQDTHLMTVSASIPFYFYDAAHQDNELSIPWASYEEVLAYARKEHGDVIAAPEWHMVAAGYPSAPQLVAAGAPPPGLEHVGTVGAEEPYRVFVYRVKPDDGGR